MSSGPPFSNRLDWAPTTNRIAAARDSRQAAGLPIIDLTVANPGRAGLHGPIVDAACPLLYQPDPFGALSARSAVAAYYAESHSAEVSPEDIVLTPSTSDAYSWLFRLLCDPGDDVIVPRPSYPLFDYLAALDGIRAVPCHQLRDAGTWHLAIDAMAALCHRRTRAVIVVNPNNPTGTFLSRAEQQVLNELCARSHMVQITDEVFLDYPWRADANRSGTMAGSDHPGFVLSGLSKICGLPQEKLSWIVICGPPAFRARARAALALIGDAYLSVAGRVQAAAPALFAGRHPFQQALLARVTANRRKLSEDLAGSSISMLPGEGGWSAVLQLPRARSDEEWSLHLLEHAGILTHPGYLFDFLQPSCLVVSLLPENMPNAACWQAED